MRDLHVLSLFWVLFGFLQCITITTLEVVLGFPPLSPIHHVGDAKQWSEVQFSGALCNSAAELRSEALRQCWATRQWDIVPRPSWSYGDVTPRILQDQHPAIHLQILVNPFITSWNPRWNIFKTSLHDTQRWWIRQRKALQHSPGQATNASHLKLGQALQIR